MLDPEVERIWNSLVEFARKKNDETKNVSSKRKNNS